jgi:predicted GNAT family acetyltransferase
MFQITENKLILKVDDEEVGYIIFDEQKDHYVGTYVYVDPAHRGKDYANQLVARFVEMAQEKNFKIVPVCHVINRKLNDKYPEMIK